MEKFRSSPLSVLFPWLSPLVIKFTIVNGGIEVQLYKNNRLLKNWQPSKLRHVLPELLIKWMNDHHIHMGPQPYPLVKQLWQNLMPLTSTKFIIDSSALAELEDVNQPQNFALVWMLNSSLVRIEGHYEGIDRYMGMGWFQKGTKIWSLENNPSNAMYSQCENLILPIEQADFLLNSTIPYLQYHLPTRAHFRLITNFTLQVIVPNASNRMLILALQSNYPQFLDTIQVPEQKVDVLLANQAIIHFPHQALTPVMIQLLQSSSSITIQDAGIPLFIAEQLPLLRHYRQISDNMAAKITQSNPIVSIATLHPTLSVSHAYENGIGRYTTTARYQYQQHTLDMDALLAAHQQNQRFVQQHAVWFEWPYGSNDLFYNIQQQRTTKVMPPKEVMFDTGHVALSMNQPMAHSIQVSGTTPAERAQSVFEQLRHHGIPGGIVGEPVGIVNMFVNVCEKLLRDNRQARILWLVPSNKKGSVTRGIHGSTMSSYITVASPVTLRDEPALISRSWTVVIFQGLDQLLDGSSQARTLSLLTWKWMLISVTSKHLLNPSIMRVLHLPEQYYEQFCTRYLFDLDKNSTSEEIGHNISGLNTAPSPIRRTIELNQKTIVKLHQETEQLQDRLLVEIEEEQEQPQFTSEQHFGSIFPVEQRVAILKQYWHFFDEIHARQKVGMKPLWGLVEDFRLFDFDHRYNFQEPYQSQLYQQLLPSAILAEIDQLWGTTMLPRWPERIISEPFPHMLLAETFGPALTFWHGCALTAWFFCEGPSSRTSVAGLAEYYQKDIHTLKEMGTPINELLFEELTRAQTQLGQPQQFTRQVATTQGKPGIAISFTTKYGTRRESFERLRDIISYYRLEWTKKHLNQYLQKRWETELREAAHAYNLYINQKRIPPTAKQFAKDAKAATNHWFGGNISGLYGAIQEKSPLQPQRFAILPPDRRTFAFTVFKTLSASENHSSTQKSTNTSQQVPHTGRIVEEPYYQLNKLAELSFRYIQLEEALGHTPTMKDFGASKFAQWSTALHRDIDKAWTIFSCAIQAAKQVLPTSAVAREPAKTEPDRIKSISSPTIRPAVQLNQEAISKLLEESEQLQERLIVETEEEQETQHRNSVPDPAPLLVKEIPELALEVDEDWKIILQQWQPEHWEILTLLCQEHHSQLAIVEHKVHRPISRLIDEINAPVDEQLGDLLVDPDTQTISNHLHTTAKSLVCWYLSSKGR